MLATANKYFLLEMSWTIVIRGIPSTQNSLECLPELRAEYSVDYWIQSGVEVSQPEEKTEGGRTEISEEKFDKSKIQSGNS